MDNRYRIAPPVIPREDISGPTGARLLRLMRIQVERDAAWLKGLLRDVDPQTGAFPIPPLGESTWPSHTLNHVCGCAYMLAALALFDPSEEPIPGLDGRGPAECALALIRSGTASHPISGSALAREDLWWLEGNRRIHALRLEHSLGMGAWLLWNRLDPETQRLLARMLEYDADLFNDLAAPTQCHDDTQAETNAWAVAWPQAMFSPAAQPLAGNGYPASRIRSTNVGPDCPAGSGALVSLL